MIPVKLPYVHTKSSDREKTDVIRAMHQESNRWRYDWFAWDAPAVPAASAVDTTLTTASYPTVRGLKAGMAVSLTPPSTIVAGLVFQAWCAADDTLTVRLFNATAAPIDLAPGTWGYMAVGPT